MAEFHRPTFAKDDPEFKSLCFAYIEKTLAPRIESISERAYRKQGPRVSSAIDCPYPDHQSGRRLERPIRRQFCKVAKSGCRPRLFRFGQYGNVRFPL